MIQGKWIIKAEDEAKLSEWLKDDAGALLSYGQDQEDQASGPMLSEGELTIGKPFMVETVPAPVVMVTFKADIGKLKRSYWVTPCILGGDENPLETFDEDGDRLDGEAFDYGEVKDLPDLSAVYDALDALKTLDSEINRVENAIKALDAYVKAVSE